ncbi:MAG: O-acetyl-ADP-ribose deacetylase [Chloroflexota bacterium]
MTELKIGNCTLSLVQGDITQIAADAIVNAANHLLAGGGGVDGAIHRAGGPSIMEECRRIGGCPPGEARITGAGNLPARFVIHAVGPIWRGGANCEDELLASAYRYSLRLAVENGVASLAFPSLSTGAYGYPLEEAAQIALRAVLEHCRRQAADSTLRRVTFVLYNGPALRVFAAALDEVGAAVSQDLLE